MCRATQPASWPSIFGQQKAAFWRGVVAGEAGEFFVEVLKAEAEAEGLRVFEEEFAGLGDLGRRIQLETTQKPFTTEDTEDTEEA